MVQSSEFVGMDQELQDEKCPGGDCSLDWHIDGDMSHRTGVQSEKMWMMVHKDGGEDKRHHSNLMVVANDVLERTCDMSPYRFYSHRFHSLADGLQQSCSEVTK